MDASTSSMDRAAAIRLSMRAFVCGLVGLLLPVVGLVPALYALFCWARVGYRYGTQWNPAQGYLTAGAVLATLAVLLTILITIAIAVSIA